MGPKLKISEPIVNRQPSRILILTIAAVLTFATHAGAASWTDPGYLYRYIFWGARNLISSDEWKLFPVHTIQNPPDAFHFTPGSSDALPQTVEYYDGDTLKRVPLDELLSSSGTLAFIVVRDDELLYERYFSGYQRDSVCVSRSVSKSFVSALIGIAIDEGFIKSADDPIGNYLPELRRQGLGSITIRNLLTMESGIRYRLGYFPWDEEPLAYFHPDLSKLLSDLTVVEPPGQSVRYCSYNTALASLILKRTTHRRPSDYLQEKIWKPLGMEYPATWSIDSDQDDLELTFAALNARAIDFAKFGCLFLNNGNWNGRQIVPQHWVIESTTLDRNDNRPWKTYSDFRDRGGYYKYFWWGRTLGDGDYSFEAQGLWGQYIFVYPKTRVVIVRAGSDYGISPEGWQQVLQYVAAHTRDPSNR